MLEQGGGDAEHYEDRISQLQDQLKNLGRAPKDIERFDVDGAYNIRYEIIKKRVDKALVDGTEERLRAPGKLAIVYAAEKDRIEYMEYLRFLASRKLILPDIEELPIGKLQGVEGLRALRVTVDVGEQCCEG